jgi:hypothetical protein
VHQAGETAQRTESGHGSGVSVLRFGSRVPVHEQRREGSISVQSVRVALQRSTLTGYGNRLKKSWKNGGKSKFTP